MNGFAKLINHHDSRVAAERQAAVDAAENEKTEAGQRELSFASSVEHIVSPLFEDFVAALRGSGRDATFKPLSKDGHGRSNVNLHFNATQGTRLRVNASDDSAYAVTLLEDGDVEFRSYYDQRPGKNGISKRSGDLGSIDAETIRHDLQVLLNLALESRAQ
ncbi:hypothetical protein [Paraburkholderia nodosa]|uniref:hypothetical protein n=1 Tax=Paraburkholderia nodosa TaxID=392320 RepID=UPI000841A6C5|nr:hypothetical protein [Paraburkholderia nodosa]